METCKSCGSTHLWKHGVKDGSQQWMCADCHRTPCESVALLVKKFNASLRGAKAKIRSLEIDDSPDV